MKKLFSYYITIALLCMVGCITGCDSRPKSNADAEAGRRASTDGKCRERVEFERLLAEWRDVVSELAKLNVECRIHGTRDVDQARQQYAELVTQGEEMQSQLISAASTAYAKRPADNKDLINFLLTISQMEIAREQYETGLRILQTLIDNGIDPPGIYPLAIKTAVNANEFELAKTFLDMQEKKGVDPNDVTYGENRALVEYCLQLWRREEIFRDSDRAGELLPRVKLQTNKGEIELELFENEAPNTVANFIALVEKGFYDGLEFYRVVGGEEAYAGCPNGDGAGGPGYSIDNESQNPNLRCHFRGSISMVNSDVSPGSSKFFICFTPRGQYDGRHTVFGHVVRGMDVLAKLQRRVPRDKMSTAINPHSNIVIPPADRIISATVVRKRPHSYKPTIRP